MRPVSQHLCYSTCMSIYSHRLVCTEPLTALNLVLGPELDQYH